MSYILFVLAGLAATLLGYGFGRALSEWERLNGAPENEKVLVILIVLVGTTLLAISGLVFLLTNLRLISFVASPILLAVGFRFGHPDAPRRMQQVMRTMREIASTLRR